MNSGHDELVQSLIRGGLLTQEEGQQALLDSVQLGGSLGGESITSHLSSQGKLSDFQVAAIRQGKVTELTIGNYLILDRLGAGGMGTVYKARHRRMKRIVALKMLAPHLSQNKTFLTRFQREVEAVARLKHPNILQAFDADECDAGHFLVMEFLDGQDLGQLVKSQGPLRLREAVAYVLQAAGALAYAHGEGIVHRDIKPANLMRERNGQVKVLDLGLARFTDVLAGSDEQADATHTGSIAGTVDFMAPEQALNTKLADHRADIYSLGCTLFYLLTGRHLHEGGTLLEKILAHRDQPVEPVARFRVDVPPWLDTILLKMVAKTPAERQQSMSELARELETGVVEDRPVHFFPGRGPDAQSLEFTTRASGRGLTLSDLNVLVVEPSRTQATVIASLLGKLGTKAAQTAKSGAAALAALASAPPQLVICALHLPDMSGTELLTRMRADARWKDVAFILVSSLDDFSVLRDVAMARRVAILPKPFDTVLLSWAMGVAVEELITHSMMLPRLTIAKAHVLLVDDSAVARARVRNVLESVGLRLITEAGNGREARDLLDANTFHLVVTDYNMPEMTGEELLRYIRWQSKQRSVPVIMVTSETDEGRRANVRHLGVSALSDKDLDPQVVRSVLMGSFTI